MITAHYRGMGFGLPLRNQQFDYSITKKSKFSKCCSLSALMFHSFLISEGYYCSSL